MIQLLHENLDFKGWGRFEKWSISSPVLVQIDRELVGLITLIGLNKFLTHITSSKFYKFMPAPLAPILVYFMIFDQYNFIDGWYTYERNCIEKYIFERNKNKQVKMKNSQIAIAFRSPTIIFIMSWTRAYFSNSTKFFLLNVFCKDMTKNWRFHNTVKIDMIIVRTSYL